ncbi:MAG: DNA-formamidopyrimidine glycosylase [Firmicutes bacterium]|nr:DNA-formamidopyrimidine glycosylase [Bacillota bacterium]
MPELPEVEVIRRELEPLVKGKTFATPVLLMPSTVQYPDPDLFAAALEGQTVKTLGRRGKYLLLILDQGILVMHLRMTGNIIFSSIDDLPRADRFLRVELPFTDGSMLQYSDMRRFGRLWLVKDLNELESLVLKNVGPDIYTEIDLKQFKKLLEKRGKRNLKALLLDQSCSAGMGNIYTDECLHLCHLHPEQQAATLTVEETEQLYNTIQQVLEMGIEHGGTSFRDYRNARGAIGDFQNKLNVYGRKGERCSCGELVAKTVVAGRGTYYCPCCQVKKESTVKKKSKKKGDNL